MAANKCDLFDNEAVPEEKARKFAEEIGAIFKLTSAFNSTGIEELFIAVGSKYIDPNFKDDGKKEKENVIVMNNTINQPLEVPQIQNEQKSGNNENLKKTEDKDRSPSIRLNPEKVKTKKKKKFC